MSVRTHEMVQQPATITSTRGLMRETRIGHHLYPLRAIAVAAVAGAATAAATVAAVVTWVG